MNDLSTHRFCVSQGTKTSNCDVCRVRYRSVCSFLNEQALDRLRAVVATGFLERGSKLCELGEPVTHIRIIAHGVVRLFRIMQDGRRQVTGFLGPGDLLGTMKRDASWHCSAEAVTDLISCTFSRKVFVKLLSDFPELALDLLICTTDEIEAQHEHAMLLGRGNPREKVATLLLMLTRRWQEGTETSNDIDLPMTRGDIADYLGLTIETVSRTFSQFKAEQIIKLPARHKVHISNLAALYEAAGVDEIPERGISLGL